MWGSLLDCFLYIPTYAYHSMISNPSISQFYPLSSMSQSNFGIRIKPALAVKLCAGWKIGIPLSQAGLFELWRQCSHIFSFKFLALIILQDLPPSGIFSMLNISGFHNYNFLLLAMAAKLVVWILITLRLRRPRDIPFWAHWWQN